MKTNANVFEGVEVLSIIFRGEVRVSLDEAMAYMDADFTHEPVGAVCLELATGKIFKTSGKGWRLWSPSLEKHVCARIGLGAYGDSVVVEREYAELKALNPEYGYSRR